VQKILQPRRKCNQANRQPQFLQPFFSLTITSRPLIALPYAYDLLLITLGAAALFFRRFPAKKLMNGMQQAPDFIQLPPDSPSADSGRHGTLSRDHYVSLQNL
jgi:hypothetical protein